MTTAMRSQADCVALDAADRLAPLRELFALPADVVYLDGNSLGALPKATVGRLDRAVRGEWGDGLIRSWNDAGWVDLPGRVGDRIARLIGAGPGEVMVADSTSVNLFKALSAAAFIAKAEAPARRFIVSERGNFPTDLYIADGVARQHGLELKLIDTGRDEDGGLRVDARADTNRGMDAATGIDAALANVLDDTVAILLLTHVDYRSGRMHPMAETTRAAHRAGALVVWDLAHSAGAVPVDLHAGGDADAAADFAIGCGYKYLNGGPGAPAFVWAHPRHTARLDAAAWRPPLAGWFGHAAPFAFEPAYVPAPGIRRFACGTPPVLSLAALDAGLEAFDAAEALGGLAALRRKSVALSDLFIELVEARCDGMGLTLVTPRDPARRGSQASFRHPDGGLRVMQALIAEGVIGDFRAPDVLRFGFTPLYTRFVDVWRAADTLGRVLERGAWRDPRFAARGTVT